MFDFRPFSAGRSLTSDTEGFNFVVTRIRITLLFLPSDRLALY